MSLWRQLTRGLRVLFDRPAADRDLADELSHYLDESTADHARRGLSPSDARRAALLDLGGATAVRDRVRSAGWESAVDSLAADFRYAVRRLIHQPAFTAAAVLTLALGIGASTAIFSVVHAVLLRPLPYPEPQQLVRVWEQSPNGHRMSLAISNLDDFRTQNGTLTALGAYELWPSTVTGGIEPQHLDVAHVSRDFFPILGVAPFRGRSFAPEEERPHGAAAALVSYRYWQQSLGAAGDLSGVRLIVDGVNYSVIGVMPAAFDYPIGAAAWISSELDPEPPRRTAHNWRVIGRVRPNLTVVQARADLDAIARRLRARYGRDVDLADAAVAPLADSIVGDVRTALLTLLASVGLLLLIACANVAGLLLARTAARRKELAVRAALGAGRGRLVQQFLAESLALSAAAGTVGVAVALWAVRLLPAIVPAGLPRQEGIAVDSSVLLFALAATAAVALSLGLFAAWRFSGADLQPALASGSRGNTGTASAHRLRGFLVAGEIATTLVILIGAGLLGRSFLRLVSTDPGFNPDHLVTVQFSLPAPPGFSHTDAAQIARQVGIAGDLLSRVRALPGVESATLAGAMPVAAGDNLSDGTFLILNGRQPPANFRDFSRLATDPGQTGHADFFVAGDGYFRTLGIPLLRGRFFGPQDDPHAPHAALISASLARSRWPHQDPIGMTLEFGNMDGNLQPITIVGIVGDIHGRGLDQQADPLVYVNFEQRGINLSASPTLLLRSNLPLSAVAPAVRAIFHDIAPDSPVKISTFADEMGGWLAERRFLLLLTGFFAAAALTLAAIGIYGVVAFSVTRRTQEIGVRVALGAGRRDVLRLVVGEGARLALAGVAAGIVLSFAATRLLASLLYGISPADPVTFAAVAGLLAAVALLASYLPARRAMRLDPTVALRYE
jgi:predicted permease